MYKSYLSYNTDLKNSRRRVEAYSNSEQLKHLTKGANFFESNGELFIDLREIRHVTVKPDPPERVLKPHITFKFENALTESHYLEVFAFYPCQYKLTTAGDSRNITKIVKFLPSASQQYIKL